MFNPPLQVPFSTPTFAVPSACASIFDAPDSYAGGTNLYPAGCPAPGSNPIVEATYDIGLPATSTEPPSVVPAMTPRGVALLILGLLASSLLFLWTPPVLAMLGAPDADGPNGELTPDPPFSATLRRWR